MYTHSYEYIYIHIYICIYSSMCVCEYIYFVQAARIKRLSFLASFVYLFIYLFSSIAVRYNALQCVVACCSVLQTLADSYCSECVAVCGRVLRCVSVCCIVLQTPAGSCTVQKYPHVPHTYYLYIAYIPYTQYIINKTITYIFHYTTQFVCNSKYVCNMYVIRL